MRIEPKLSLAALLLLSLLAAASAKPPGTSFETALQVDLIPGKLTLPEEGYYQLNETRSEAYFELRGLEGGMKLTMELEALGAEQGRSIITLYSGEGALIRREKVVYGEGTRSTIELAYQPSMESAEPGARQYLVLKRYSGAMRYRITFTVDLVEDYAPGEGDAGADPETAISLPPIAGNSSISFTGHLASRDEGDDFADYYKLRVSFGASGESLKIRVKPSGGLQVAASLYKETYMLKHNASKGHGEPIELTLTGEWESGKEYGFLLRIDNSGGRGGGSYEVEAWVEGGPSQTSTATQPNLKPEGLDETTIKALIIVGAAALVVISIAMLILKRRRIYRVEEVGWWGGSY